jgi:Zn-dependent membrane protease YugP
MWFDYWWIMIPGLILGFYAQLKLSATYNRYAQVPAARGLTGAEAARSILVKRRPRPFLAVRME